MEELERYDELLKDYNKLKSRLLLYLNYLEEYKETDEVQYTELVIKSLKHILE